MYFLYLFRTSAIIDVDAFSDEKNNNDDVEDEDKDGEAENGKEENSFNKIKKMYLQKTSNLEILKFANIFSNFDYGYKD